MEIKLCRDRALVSTPTIRIRTAKGELFFWWSWRPRLYWLAYGDVGEPRG